MECVKKANPHATLPKQQSRTFGEPSRSKGPLTFASADQESIDLEEMFGKVSTTREFLEGLRSKQLLSGGYVPLEGEVVATRGRCIGCGLTLGPENLKRYGENVVCVLCKPVFEIMNFPLDITPSQKMDLQREVLDKPFRDSLESATSVGDFQMAFLARKVMPHVLVEMANEQIGKKFKAHYDAKNPNEPAELFSFKE
jgi:hypothetical protein